MHQIPGNKYYVLIQNLLVEKEVIPLIRALISVVSKLSENLLWKIRENQEQMVKPPPKKKLHVLGPSVQTNLILYNH